MTQEELKQEFINYAQNNLNNETLLQAIQELLCNISSELYNEGYSKESNRLTTCELIIKEVLFKSYKK